MSRTDGAQSTSDANKGVPETPHHPDFFIFYFFLHRLLMDVLLNSIVDATHSRVTENATPRPLASSPGALERQFRFGRTHCRLPNQEALRLLPVRVGDHLDNRGETTHAVKNAHLLQDGSHIRMKSKEQKRACACLVGPHIVLWCHWIWGRCFKFTILLHPLSALRSDELRWRCNNTPCIEIQALFYSRRFLVEAFTSSFVCGK